MIETVGERIRELRIEKGLSQRQLAKTTVGVSDAYISRIEAGDRNVSLKALREIARVLEVNPVYLETGELKYCPHCGRPF